MKPLIVFASCVLIASAHVTRAQEPVPNTTPAPQRHAKPARGHKSAKRQPANQSPTPAPNARTGSRGKVGADAAATNNRVAFSEALGRYRHARHDHTWWKRHYTLIVLVGGGYYYWDAGYWCPAWGYDPAYEYYDYDGPIYTYGDLLPDQVIVNVQRALKQLGYYAGGITGSLGSTTRAAIAAYQRDSDLDVTGAIDAATVETLGLN
jgi:hypothetical protein